MKQADKLFENFNRFNEELERLKTQPVNNEKELVKRLQSFAELCNDTLESIKNDCP